MSTDRQRAANRANAQRSTGPRTTRGRAAVRSNPLQHGFYGRVAIPDFEDTAGYHALLDDYLADLHPAGAVEIELVHRLVMQLWKLRRLEHLERSFLIASIDRAERDVEAATATPAQLAAYAFEHWVETQFLQFKSEAPIERLSRLQYRLRRSADATLRLLRELQSERLAAPGPFAEIASAGEDQLAYFSTQPASDPTLAFQASSNPDAELAALIKARASSAPPPESPADATLPVPSPTAGPDPQPITLPDAGAAPSSSGAADSDSPALSTTGPPAPAAPPTSVHPADPPPIGPKAPETPSTSSTIHKPNPEIGFVPPKSKSTPAHPTPKRSPKRPLRRPK